MKTKAVRLYGEMDLRLEEFELPQIKDDEILVKVMTDSICMSSYKLAKQGKKHMRAPENIDTHPIIVGHEFAGEIVKVGSKWQNEFKPGEKFAQQPALNYNGTLSSLGYSYEFCGGDSTYCIMPNEVMEMGCLLHYSGDCFFKASLGEPLSCIASGFHTCFHTVKNSYEHTIGTKAGGNILILGGCGPMGLGMVSYAMNIDNKPKRIVVTDVNQPRLNRAYQVMPEEDAKAKGVELHFVDSTKLDNEEQYLMELSEGHGYDDIFVMVQNKAVAEMGDRLLAVDGCMNFFCGPTDKQFSAEINLYNSHYKSTHILGSTGGTNEDLIEVIGMIGDQKIEPAVMVTHIGGLDNVIEVTKNVPNIPGGKKLIYTQIEMPLTAIEDFEELGKNDEFFAQLAKSCKAHNGLWNAEAEKILLKHYNV